ncbi:methyl-accepting chemotaxis protein [Noviherbaspirillum saxi]|nr:methyl-accepting chemotaxis protein [Noviherbaspirillum saxi]
MKVGTRLTAGFACVLLLLIVVTMLGLQQMTQLQARLEQITTANNVKVKLATAMRDSVFERMVALRNLALGSSAPEMHDEMQSIRREAGKYKEAELKLKQIIAASSAGATEERMLLEGLNRFETIALSLSDKAADLAMASQIDQAYTVTRELAPAQRKWMSQLEALIAFEGRQSEQSTIDARSAFTRARFLMLAIGLLAVVIGMLIAILITRKMLRQLGGEPEYAARIVGQLASGDLTAQIDIRPSDSGSLLLAMRSMRENLASTIGRARADSSRFVAVSSEICAGNANIASRTEQQACELESTVERMERLTATVQHNLESVHHANQLAASASAVALMGSAEVLRVVETMNSIETSARRIVDIIGVIDGIVFQTNILALNASVEAARAGEQGRGFAVVASEVRSLAQRAATSAKEIKALIDDAVEKVDAGGILADNAGATMNKLAESIQRVTKIMQEITEASSVQGAEIAQVNQTIAQMERMTQQNAALVERAAAVTESMQQRAHGLAQILQVFKVADAATESDGDHHPSVLSLPRA